MFRTPSRLGRGAGAGFSSLLQTMRLISPSPIIAIGASNGESLRRYRARNDPVDLIAALAAGFKKRFHKSMDNLNVGSDKRRRFDLSVCEQCRHDRRCCRRSCDPRERGSLDLIMYGNAPISFRRPIGYRIIWLSHSSDVFLFLISFGTRPPQRSPNPAAVAADLPKWKHPSVWEVFDRVASLPRKPPGPGDVPRGKHRVRRLHSKRSYSKRVPSAQGRLCRWRRCPFNYRTSVRPPLE
jgi:hypothetical protein